jgi:hypothetical protein
MGPCPLPNAINQRSPPGHHRTGIRGKNLSRRLSRAGGADFVIQELAKDEFIINAPLIGD